MNESRLNEISKSLQEWHEAMNEERKKQIPAYQVYCGIRKTFIYSIESTLEDALKCQDLYSKALCGVNYSKSVSIRRINAIENKENEEGYNESFGLYRPA